MTRARGHQTRGRGPQTITDASILEAKAQDWSLRGPDTWCSGLKLMLVSVLEAKAQDYLRLEPPV